MAPAPRDRPPAGARFALGRDEESILVRPVFAAGAAGRAAVPRWRDELGAWTGNAGRRIVVIPDRSRMPTSDPAESGATVLKLADLRALVAATAAPRQRRTR